MCIPSAIGEFALCVCFHKNQKKNFILTALNEIFAPKKKGALGVDAILAMVGF